MNADAKTPQNIHPRIYVALPKTGPADLTVSGADSPVMRPLAADLLVKYGFDVGTHFEMAAHRDLERLGVDEAQLHEHALANLRALSLEVKAHQGDRIAMLTAGGNYEATLLLLPELWDAIAPMAAGSIVAAVPARDILCFTGDADPENLSDLRRYTSQMLEKADKPLSRSFLKRNGSGWEAYRGHAE